jgi:quinol monooxygenase YgiN
MIVVTGMFEIAAEDRDAAVEAAIQMMNETAKEEGCITYRFYSDVEHPTKIRVYEEWETDTHLAAHTKTAHMAVWRQALGGLKVLSRAVKKFEAGPAEKLG